MKFDFGFGETDRPVHVFKERERLRFEEEQKRISSAEAAQEREMNYVEREQVYEQGWQEQFAVPKQPTPWQEAVSPPPDPSQYEPPYEDMESEDDDLSYETDQSYYKVVDDDDTYIDGDSDSDVSVSIISQNADLKITCILIILDRSILSLFSKRRCCVL